MALVAPNALQVLEQFGWFKTRRNPRYTINDSITRLLRVGLIQRNERGFLRLTSSGEKRISAFYKIGFQTKKPKKWDGKWRLVSFDIKEKRRELRDQLRTTLNAVGFVHLHHSLWIYPYDCQDLITLLKADFEIGKDILYIVSDYVENDRLLRRYFNLN